MSRNCCRAASGSPTESAPYMTDGRVPACTTLTASPPCRRHQDIRDLRRQAAARRLRCTGRLRSRPPAAWGAPRSRRRARALLTVLEKCGGCAGCCRTLVVLWSMQTVCRVSILLVGLLIRGGPTSFFACTMVNLVTNGHLATCNMLHLTRAPRTQFTYVPLSTGWEAGWGGGIGRASALLSPGGLGQVRISPLDYYSSTSK